MNSNRAQEIQDNIFRKMTADKKMQVVVGFWLLAKEFNSDFLECAYSYENNLKYGNSRSKKTFGKNSKNIG